MNELNKKVDCVIDGETYKCPSNTKNVIKRWYGEDSLTTKRLTHTHNSNKIDGTLIGIFSLLKQNKILED